MFEVGVSYQPARACTCVFIAVRLPATESDLRYPQLCGSLIQTRLSLITPRSTNLALKIRGNNTGLLFLSLFTHTQKFNNNS